MSNHFGILVLVLAAFSAASNVHSPLRQQSLLLKRDQAEETLSRLFAVVLFDRVAEKGKSANILIPVIPTLPDPAELTDIYITLPGGNLTGTATLCNSVVTGTSLITDDLAFSLNIPARINYALNSPSLHVEGQADVNLDLMNGFLRLISSGHYTVDLTDGDVKAEIKVMVRLNGEFEITEASIDLSFGALALNATEALVNGEPIVWEEFNAQIKDLFDSIWPLIKPKLEEAVKGIGNEIFKDCNIYTLIGGDFSCLGIGKKDVHELLMKEMFKITSLEASCPAQGTPPPHDGSYLIYSDNITNFGNWPNAVDRCPEGSFANGFQVKTESYQTPFSDDTAMNALRLFCSGTEESVTSNEGGWGVWGNTYRCDSDGVIKGFQLRIEEGGEPDMTATNNIRILCSDNPNGSIEGDGLGFGLWRNIFICGDGFAACGIKTQVESDQGPLTDDTALNNIAFLCCPNAQV